MITRTHEPIREFIEESFTMIGNSFIDSNSKEFLEQDDIKSKMMFKFKQLLKNEYGIELDEETKMETFWNRQLAAEPEFKINHCLEDMPSNKKYEQALERKILQIYTIYFNKFEALNNKNQQITVAIDKTLLLLKMLFFYLTDFQPFNTPKAKPTISGIKKYLVLLKPEIPLNVFNSLSELVQDAEVRRNEDRS